MPRSPIPSARTRGPLQKVMLRLTREQAAALREEALRRATAAGRSKLDVSAVAREALEAWRAKPRTVHVPLKSLAHDAATLAADASTLATRLASAGGVEG